MRVITIYDDEREEMIPSVSEYTICMGNQGKLRSNKPVNGRDITFTIKQYKRGLSNHEERLKRGHNLHQ